MALTMFATSSDFPGFSLNLFWSHQMKKLATIAVAALFGLGLASAADAQQKPMGASGSSMSSSAPAKSAAKKMPAKKMAAHKSSAKAGSASVKAVQEALNKNGAALKVDGKMGKATMAALKKYQSANGLKATGHVDAATKAKLGV
jgi:peptidoglycan hydrolase-like protein with peptidoglycan-binding domain